uniref:Uncharacterized protein n=1 Tax=Arundo donax TaxID=35708 RepID=A0A0A8YDT4_ARUDO
MEAGLGSVAKWRRKRGKWKETAGQRGEQEAAAAL